MSNHAIETQTDTVNGVTSTRYVCTCGAESAWAAVSGDAWDTFTGFPACVGNGSESVSEPDAGKVLTYEIRSELNLMCAYRIDYCESMADRTTELAKNNPALRSTAAYWKEQMEKASALREFLDGIQRDMIEKPF